jgi:hypothetical protein
MPPPQPLKQPELLLRQSGRLTQSEIPLLLLTNLLLQLAPPPVMLLMSMSVRLLATPLKPPLGRQPQPWLADLLTL